MTKVDDLSEKDLRSLDSFSLFAIPKAFSETTKEEISKCCSENDIFKQQVVYLKANQKLFSREELTRASIALCDFWKSYKTRKDKKKSRNLFDLFPKKLHMIKSDAHFICLLMTLLNFSSNKHP